MKKVGTELTYGTAWEDLTVDEIIRVALEAARPIHEAEYEMARGDIADLLHEEEVRRVAAAMPATWNYDDDDRTYYRFKAKGGSPIRLGTCTICGAVHTPGARALHDAWHKTLAQDIRQAARGNEAVDDG